MSIAFNDTGTMRNASRLPASDDDVKRVAVFVEEPIRKFYVQYFIHPREILRLNYLREIHYYVIFY